MSRDGYLPPGVTDSMIPGNTPEDVEWEEMVDAIQDTADELFRAAVDALSASRHFTVDRWYRDRLLCDALGIKEP